jgi:hypothetical protein
MSLANGKENAAPAAARAAVRMRDEKDHDAMLGAAEAWREIKATSRQLWAKWTTVIGPALAKARAEAMYTAGANQPKGRGYNGAMSALLIVYGLDGIEQVTRADLLMITEHLDLVESWRSRQKQPESLNHPSTVWRQFEKSNDWKDAQVALGLKADEGPKPKAPKIKANDKKHFSADELANENPLAAKEIEVEDLKTKLAEANARLEAARTANIDRSVEAYERLPASPAVRPLQ